MVMETDFPISALIAAPEGVLSSALRTFLETLPGVRVVARSTSQADALRDLAGHRPTLLLLDCSLNGGGDQNSLPLQSFLAQIHTLVPGITTITIANDLQQRQLAVNAGAGQVILKSGFDPSLRQAVEHVSHSFQQSARS
jgi:DNA-binding NarL/FixJ family response regulator